MSVDRDLFSTEKNCSVKRALDIVGEKWTLLVLREAFYGARRFERFQTRIGCPRQVLTDRLNTLVAAGVLRKVPYQEPGQRERHEYRLTEKGRDLLPAVIALMQWGDTWEADPPTVHRSRSSTGIAAIPSSSPCDVATTRPPADRP